ncbi:hypothetical protein M422DRAFT_263935 [Sphaerobolus stellatus SS14]|uniref:SWIM-type domain-containing protein n=1 Tax=Sphaerobolus stellatus (strain SS14) TaxID=990650 RepID=A0A0C9V938_SPHS4|nr:hypothetical protein M422DRAFT_263935 [Sphaerobolus stellatus SS14]
MLVHLLVMKVLPSIFEQRQLEKREEQRWHDMLRKLPGGEDLLKGHAQGGPLPRPVIAYFIPDAQRDAATQALCDNKQIGIPTQSENGFLFQCYSAFATEYDLQPQIYQIYLGWNRIANCSCPDFLNRGGACKHLRAAILKTESLQQSGLTIPLIPIPKSESEAHTLHTQTIATHISATTPLSDPMDLSPIAKAAATISDIMNENLEVLFDGNEAEAAEPTIDDEETAGSDSESVTTDAGDEFDFSMLMSSSRTALDAQSMVRLGYELLNAAHKMGDMASMMPSTPPIIRPESVQNFKVFYSSIMRFAEKILHLIEGNEARSQIYPTMPVTTQLTNDPKSCPPPSSTSLKHPGSPIASQRRAPIPISPEKSQKHKPSYSIF